MQREYPHLASTKEVPRWNYSAGSCKYFTPFQTLWFVDPHAVIRCVTIAAGDLTYKALLPISSISGTWKLSMEPLQVLTASACSLCVSH